MRWFPSVILLPHRERHIEEENEVAFSVTYITVSSLALSSSVAHCTPRENAPLNVGASLRRFGVSPQAGLVSSCWRVGYVRYPTRHETRRLKPVFLDSSTICGRNWQPSVLLSASLEFIYFHIILPHFFQLSFTPSALVLFLLMVKRVSLSF